MNRSPAIRLTNPLVRVSITWLWLIIPFILEYISPAFGHRINRHPYFSIGVEILLAGLVPVLFTIFRSELFPIW